jgi:hypothetical protein
MPGARCTRGLVCKVHEKTHTSIQVQRKHSGIPRAMALRLMPRSPRRRIRLVTVIGGLRFCRTRLGSQHLHRFSTSNGCQDHTVLPYAATRLRQEASPGFGAVRPARRYRSRETRPAIPFAPDAAASTASHPNVSDDPDTPLAGDETAGFLPVIWGKREEEYFLGTRLTGQITLKALGNFLFRRNAVKRGQSTNLMPNIRPLRQTTSQGWRFG